MPCFPRKKQEQKNKTKQLNYLLKKKIIATNFCQILVNNIKKAKELVYKNIVKEF